MKPTRTILTGKKAKNKVTGILKEFVLQVEEGKYICAEFPDEMGGEIDRIESEKTCGKIFQSTQHTDVGERPIQMNYTPAKSIEWKHFVTELESVFNKVFNYKPKKKKR